MFAQLSVLALALAPLASALTLQIPVDWHSSSQVNISWSNVASDPPFSLQLVNTNEFHDTFAIANNLNPSADFASFQLGVIPEGQYTLRAINVTNANQIYDETPSFTIQAPLSTSSRFYTAIQPIASDASSAEGPIQIRVRSPQFEDASWLYFVDFDGPNIVRVEHVADNAISATTKNKFVHLALQRTLSLAAELKSVGTLQNTLSYGLDIAIVGDNDFYSQRAQLAAQDLPPTLDSLSKLPPFAKTGVRLPDVHKTGLGSSAALITSLVSALLVHLNVIPADSFSVEGGTETASEGRKLAHNLAQYVHCLAQGKVGSGFDVSAAVFGSQLYTRFDPAVLAPLMKDDVSDQRLYPILSPKNVAWDYRVEPHALARGQGAQVAAGEPG
ncbi:hypothetical protein NUW54_g10581 [Trametes sanguinea]|uniref:Uncharacterized protein n=1 Tax=Trametes sanguinea TaxID=158606 RepID=A0ACC1NZJ6_9APHY|nr:hypothetical protein NUW54_g10581 [Trametes sanguinea]